MRNAQRLILFLDFDGVLHGIGKPEFENLTRLENVLREHEHVDIVITSSRREIQPLSLLVERFQTDIRLRILGATPVLKTKWPPYPKHVRHAEILQYMADRQLKAPWIALDDEANLFPPSCPQLILCNPLTGFDEEAAIHLQNKIRAEFTRLSDLA